MKSDLIGRVKNSSLTPTRGLMPLFEAIANSIHAIEDRKVKRNGKITIQIDRDGQMQTDGETHGNTQARIANITIEDNGIGFTDKNFDSFETFDSRAKEKRGGKGVGRLSWLKAFHHAAIDSTYREGDTWFRRTFEFRESPAGIEKPERRKLGTNGGHQYQTRVKLVHFRDEFREAVPKQSDTIAQRIIEHCLESFLLDDDFPEIVVRDPLYNLTFKLSSIFEQEYKREASSEPLIIGEGRDAHRLELHHVYSSSLNEQRHRLLFCAHKRVVQTSFRSE